MTSFPRLDRASSSLCRLLAPVVLCALLASLLTVPSAQAQTAQSVVEQMKATYLDQFEDVDTYVIETDLYTAYHKKTSNSPSPEFKTATQMKGQDQMFGGMGTATQGQFDQFDKIAEHGEHRGMETVDGTSCHVLFVDDPSTVNSDLGPNTESMTYYVSADDYHPRRMEVVMAPRDRNGTGTPQKVTLNLSNYKTVDGLTLPWRMEMQTNLNETMTPQQKQRLEAMKKQMEQMDEKQRKMMKRMMGDQMKQLERMMSGKPTVITVQNVTVNEPLPEGVFEGN
jgi:hypothetical protein